jgi:hypothetical protein
MKVLAPNDLSISDYIDYVRLKRRLVSYDNDGSVIITYNYYMSHDACSSPSMS